MRPSITGKRATLLVSLFVLVATVVQYDLLKFSHRQLENNDGRAGEIIPSEKIPRDLKKYLQRLRDAAVELRTEQRMLQSKNDTDGEQHQGRNPLEIARIRRAQFGIIFPEAEKMPLHLRNTMDSLHSNDVVFFWHIPKTGGKLMRVIMGNCFGLRRAERLKEPASLEFITDLVVNVDTQTPQGIADAHDMELIDSGMVDMVSSPHAISAAALFTPRHLGRAFTIMQHPVVTAVSKFSERKKIRPNLRQMSLAEYAAQDYYPDNWMVRQLTGTIPGEELTEDHLHRAKNMLLAKFFVGIADQMEETVRQVRLYYEWIVPPGKESCVRDMVRGTWPGEDDDWTPHKLPERGGDDWNTVAEREKWDMELYYLGLEMFSKQNLMLNAVQHALGPQSFW
ncbi:hypothetical protein ACHAXS_004643 [Conticribra weissflogii]